MDNSKIPLPLLIAHEPDAKTEKKRRYNLPTPFQIEENISETPAEVLIDYLCLTGFLMSLGGCLWILTFYI